LFSVDEPPVNSVPLRQGESTQGPLKLDIKSEPVLMERLTRNRLPHNPAIDRRQLDMFSESPHHTGSDSFIHKVGQVSPGPQSADYQEIDAIFNRH
jgi:hypothetical protein